MKLHKYALLGLFALLPCIASAQDKNKAKPTSGKPNIILVMADDQGWGDTGYNGHPVVKTPNLDAMAKDSLVFNRFYAAAPVCSPTRGSVLTGRHPFRIKITNHGRYMRAQETTLAAELQEAGYVTGMFGKWHVGSAQKGSPVNPGNRGFDEWVIGLNFFDNDPYLSRQGVVEQIKGSGSAITIDETISFLKRHKDGDKPMFAIAWFPSPHSPHEEKPANPNLYKGIPGGPYFEEITVLDTEFGRLRKELRELDIEKNTILWYCSDNGGLRVESSGGRNKKGSIYEGGLRIPSLLEWPTHIAPGISEFPSNTSDILPTVLSLAKVPRKGKLALDGINLKPVIEGKVTQRQNGIGFWHGFQQGQSTYSDRILKAIMDSQKAGQPSPVPERLLKDINEYPQFPEDKFIGHAAWLDWPWKLHRKEGKEVSFELYNLKTHPMENQDLSKNADQAERMKSMKQDLAKWQLSVIRSLNGKDYPK